jgi:hypothetical protein
MVTDSALEATEVFPAASVAVAVMECTPLDNVEEVIVQFPSPSATADPTCVAPSNNFTVLPASAVPLKVGVVLLVMLSLLDEPLSLAAVRSGVDVAEGAVVSIVIDKPADATDVFPAASVAVAVIA